MGSILIREWDECPVTIGASTLKAKEATDQIATVAEIPPPVGRCL